MVKKKNTIHFFQRFTISLIFISISIGYLCNLCTLRNLRNFRTFTLLHLCSVVIYFRGGDLLPRTPLRVHPRLKLCFTSRPEHKTGCFKLPGKIVVIYLE